METPELLPATSPEGGVRWGLLVTTGVAAEVEPPRLAEADPDSIGGAGVADESGRRVAGAPSPSSG